MYEMIFKQAEAYLEKYRQINEDTGRTATAEEVQLLKEKFGDLIPDWYYRLISQLPLIDAEVAWQAYEPDEDFDGLASVQFLSAEDMILESFEYDPGILVRSKGYVCIATDPGGSGDPYFVKFDRADPAVLQIYHDFFDEDANLTEYDYVTVAESFSALFANGIVPDF